MIVERYCTFDPVSGCPSGDYLRVGGVDLGCFRDLIEAEYQRAKRDHPENPAFHMRPMFASGSGFGREIMALVREVRG